ncbi:MAG: DUF3108 domain-containing protein [Oligoflexia bacterium]|nr:DUF3108 domain-containing protein [Oligoflexia bacterium]
MTTRYIATVSAICVLQAAGLAGCAGSSLSKIDHSETLPQDVITQDYSKKFEVQEASSSSAAAPTPVAQTVEIPAPLSKKTRKHREWKRTEEQKIRDVALAEIGPRQHKPLVYRDLRRDIRNGKDPIWVGERLTYDVSYLGLTAATFVLEVLPYKSIDGRKVYHIQANARSSKVFSLVYKLNDVVQSFIDYEGVFSHRFHMQLDETKQIRDSLELYDSENEEAFWWNRWNRKEKGYEEKKEFHLMEPFPQDSISVLYYLRFVPLPPNGEVKFVVESEAKPLDAVVTVVEREELETPMGRIHAIKLKPDAATRGVLERRGNSYIWLSDDDRRFLVRFEAKVKIGTIVVRLRKIELGTPPDQLRGDAAPIPVESIKQ